MRVLVTGGAGFKGVVLTEALLRRGYEVTVLDTFKWGVRPLVGLMRNPKLAVVRGDICDSSLFGDLACNHDATINLAGMVGYPECDRDKDGAWKVNTFAVSELLKLVPSRHKFIQASTGSVYGKLDSICTEESPTNPLTVYGSTKLEAESCVVGFGGVSLRFATAFGVAPCMRFDLLPNFFIWRALRDGFIVAYETAARRTLIGVHDMVAAYLLALDNYEAMQGQVYNVGDESLNVTKADLLNYTKKLIPSVDIFDQSSGADKDGRDYEVSYKKIQGFGFKCVQTLEDGMKQVLDIAKLMVDADQSVWRFT